MSTASMLAKCGLTAEQVSKMTKPKYLVAEENEAKYAEVTDMFLHYLSCHGATTYDHIAASNENGNCTCRKTTYKYWKQKAQTQRGSGLV